MADTKYLRKWKDHWQAVLDVPVEVRSVLGRRLVKSLQTSSLATANQRKLAVVADFKDRIARARQGQTDPLLAFRREGEEDSRALQDAKTFEQETPTGVVYTERDALWTGLQERREQIRDQHGDEAASVYNAALTTKGTVISERVEPWLAEIVVAGQTKSQHRSTVRDFLKWAGEFSTFETISRKRTGEYVTHMLTKSGLTRQTVKRHLSSLSSFWRWADTKGLLGEDFRNPWLGHNLGKKSKTVVRKAFEDPTLLKLLNGVSTSKTYRQVLSDLLRLDLVTGMRLEELCALKRDEVEKRKDGYWFVIDKGKTDAAIREVPIHSMCDGIVERRLADRDEFLFRNLTPGGPDEKRSWYVSKAFTRFRKSIGVQGEGEVFHALRNTFMAVMEGEGVSETTVKLFVGHKRASLTYGHYSKGERVNLRAASNAVKYSTEVEAAIRANPVRGNEAREP